VPVVRSALELSLGSTKCIRHKVAGWSAGK